MLGFLSTLIKTIHILASFLLIVTILLQAGRGGGLAGLGGGGGQTVFGGGGAAPVLARVSAILAGIFLSTSLSLAYLATRGPEASLAAKEAVRVAGLVEKSVAKIKKASEDALKSATETIKGADALLKDPKKKDAAEGARRLASEARDLANDITGKGLPKLAILINEARGQGSTEKAADAKKSAEEYQKQADTAKTKAADAKKKLDLLHPPKAPASRAAAPLVRITPPTSRAAAPLLPPASRVVLPTPPAPALRPLPTPPPSSQPAPAPRLTAPTSAPTSAPLRR